MSEVRPVDPPRRVLVRLDGTYRYGRLDRWVRIDGEWLGRTDLDDDPGPPIWFPSIALRPSLTTDDDAR